MVTYVLTFLVLVCMPDAGCVKRPQWLPMKDERACHAHVRWAMVRKDLVPGSMLCVKVRWL